MNHEKHVRFDGRIVMLGCGFIGQGILPLIFRHIDIPPERVSIITATERGREVAEECGVAFSIDPLTKENHRSILGAALRRGDFLLNLTSDVETTDILEFCGEHGVLYLDSCIDSWLGENFDAELSVSRRSTYYLRDKALGLRRTWSPNGPTAVLAHGVNPGLVSHFVKQALIDMARDIGLSISKPESREQWARLAQSLGIKAIHVSERDTQVSSRRKVPGEFVNTWSIDGLASEGVMPAELGWGSHEKSLPIDGARHEFGDQAAIYINRPGIEVRVRTWLPLAGPKIGYLITHNESLSLASYFTLGRGEKPEYRPTVHYAYHPTEDAVLSIWEFQERNGVMQENLRPIVDCITSGIDELGVLMMGGRKGVYWYGSRLSIDDARSLAPYNNATTLQVVAGVLGALIWALRHPAEGIVEAEDMDFEEVMAVALPYLGEMAGEYGDWNPIAGRNTLYPEDIDSDDPWQFKNIRVA